MKIGFVIRVAEPVPCYPTPKTLPYRELQGLLYRYVFSNIGFWNPDVVCPLLGNMRNEVKNAIGNFDAERNSIDELIFLLKRLNGMLRWIKRMPRRKTLLKLLPLLRHGQQRSLLHQDISVGELNFGLDRKPFENPFKLLHTFNSVFGTDNNTLASLENDLEDYAVKLEIFDDA